MIKQRLAGVLVHPTSMAGRFGSGDLGPEAVRFLDWCAEAGLGMWQVLPLGPAGANGSPYDAQSAFAGNPLLVSPERLRQAGWLTADELERAAGQAGDRVDFARTTRARRQLLRASWRRFSRASRESREAFERFVEAPEQAAWLGDWALFAALKRHHRGLPWTEWDADLRRRQPAALRRAALELGHETRYHCFLQFLVARQWQGVRRAARRRGVAMFGDLPFYVARDSADVWANRELFQIDADGHPLKVAGVPPDYFSDTGQLWGNPTYRWDRLAEQGYAWWLSRIRANLRQVDLLRLDHFRGYVAFWEIEAGQPTAAIGRWMPGPGRAAFDALRGESTELPLVAEDLGLITEDVVALRDGLGLPGMYVMQFAFGGDAPEHRPEHHRVHAVVYTGTHDNDTLRGWFASLTETARRQVVERLGTGTTAPCRKLLELTWASPARLAMAPLQDLLDLGPEARMNVPGVAHGNWSWRVRSQQLTLAVAARLRRLAERTGRASSTGAS